MRNFLDALSRATAMKQEDTTSGPVNRKGPPSSEEIKEMLGFDRNDPNVQVQLIPVPGLSSRLTSGKGLDIDRFMQDFAAKLNEAPVTADGNVVEAEIHHAGDDPEDEAAEQQLAEAEGEQRVIDSTDRVEGVLQELLDELERAVRKHDSMNSAHEAHSVIREEVEELWEHVKADTGYTSAARHEAIQVAAMAIRYVLDLDPRGTITTGL